MEIKQGMKAELVLLTPDLAAEWLESNKMNRKVRDRWVSFLAGEMSGGRWHLNGDSFVFDTEGVLVDGQHRCHAVIKSGFSFPAIVVRDVEPEARITIDDPLRRSFADDLVMNGFGPNAGQKETLLRRILLWERYAGLADEGHHRISRAELSQHYESNAARMEQAIKLVAHYAHRLNMSTTGAGFTAWLLLGVAPEEKVRQFFSIMAIGSQEPNDYVVIRLRNRIQRLYDEVLGRKKFAPGSTALQVWWAIKGWNAWVTGRTEAFQNPRNGNLENPFPAPAMAEIVTEA
jgi:hypothetical protein